MNGFAEPRRDPPANLDAEMALLGNLLMDAEALDQISDMLAPEDFADPGHQRIFEVMLRQVRETGRADARTVAAALKHEGALADLGGVRYIGELAANALTIINPEHYARVIRDQADRRRLIAALDKASAIAWDAESTSAREQIETLERQLFAIQVQTPGAGFQPIGTALDNALRTIEAAYASDSSLTGVPSGFQAIDRRHRGFQRSDLIILAARPSMGKTALALNFALNAAKAGHRTALFSLEMSAEQLLIRAIADETGINSHNIQAGYISDAEFRATVAARDHLAALPLHIDSAAGITPAYLRTELRRLMRRSGQVDLVIVDYLQLMASASGRRHNSRNDDVSEITREVKRIAKELGVPILMLSQLSRAVEAREDKRPQLADLRDSGSIEQDADVVMFLYREEYYLARSEPDVGTAKWDEWSRKMEAAKAKAEVITAKFRNGAVGTDRLGFIPALTRFTDQQDGAQQGEWWHESQR